MNWFKRTLFISTYFTYMHVVFRNIKKGKPPLELRWDISIMEIMCYIYFTVVSRCANLLEWI